jgi:hypothetical protein
MTVASTQPKWKPVTRLGWWAVGLMAAYVVMYILVIAVMALRLSLPPIFGSIYLLCGLAAGVVGLIAIVKQHERAWLVWVTLLPGIFTLFLLLGEFLVPLFFPALAH